ncbi:MAG: hypothetical protein MJ215_03655 [Spirochaetia bacterium]|nr:hypothetical protein [Spirochaetia bacterium]
MKKLFIIMSLFVVSNLYGETSILKAFPKETPNFAEVIKELNIDISNEIEDEKLSALNYILKNTFENNIHKMRGETGNKVYTKEDGREAVFDKNGQPVENPWNRGNYNFASYSEPVLKFTLDIWPWLYYGNSPDDPTDIEERFYYYLFDLDNGIQSYIFLEDKSILEKMKYSELVENEKVVYKFFEYLIFNPSYKHKLDAKGIKLYQKSKESYVRYFKQLLVLAGYKL